jgi:hypothetical protein
MSIKNKNKIGSLRGFFLGVVSLIIMGSVLIPEFSHAETVDASLLLSPTTASTTTGGSNVSFTARVNPGSNTVEGVNAVQLDITFSPAVVHLVSIAAVAPFTALNSPNAAAITAANVSGTLSVAFFIAGNEVTSLSDVATIVFSPQDAGNNSPIDFAGTANASVNDGSGTFVVSTRTGATVTVAENDTTMPTGGSISYTNGYQTTTAVALTVDDGSDIGSGINTSSRSVQRRSATLSDTSCGAYGSWGTISQTGTYPNFTDATVANGNCYQYQYLVSDNASTPNTANYTTANVVKIDSSAPVGSSIVYTAGYFKITSIALTVSDGVDALSGINTSSRSVQRRSATLSGTSCGAYGSWGTISQTGTYPNFTDTTVANGNCYQYQYLVSDLATNQATTTSVNDAKVDTVAPALAQISAISAVNSNNTPSYIFSSTEGGTISYSGACASLTTTAISGNNTIVFNSLARGVVYNNCTIRVTDVATNQSNILSVASFAITYRGDLNNDRLVGISDLSVLASNWNKTTGFGVADINGDSVVNLSDLSILATDYGYSF